MLRGEAGIGKTALLAYVSSRVAAWHVASAVGVESEMELPFGSLHQLCAPMLDHVDALPVPQRDALATVFGLSAGAAPDRFLVGLAVLTLFAEVAEHQPLVCIVDDAQWFDRASAQIVGFVARRVHAERIAIVCAARTGVGDEMFQALPELTVRGLADADAHALLRANVRGPFDAAILQQLVVESHGNPLALQELPRTWSSTLVAPELGSAVTQPVAGKIEESYRRRVVELPRDAQLLLLASAADPLGDVSLLHRAAATLGVDVSALEPALDASLIDVGARVRFAHPLVRSAAYRSASTVDRQRVHHALADATDVRTDPDRRAWHRARATSGPDEHVAAELERSAGRAQARGGVAAAAVFLTRATELTPDPVDRVRRALDAAFANVQSGTFDAARQLIASVEDQPLDEGGRVRIDLLRAQLAFASSRGTEATPLLLSAARRLEPIDSRLARETYLDAFSAALFGARLNDTVTVADVAAAARAAPGPGDGAATAADLLLDGLVTLVDDYARGVPPSRRALEKLAGDDVSPDEHLRWLWQGCVVALELWDDHSAYSLSQDNVQRARTTGRLTELELALSARAPVLVLCGDRAAAASAVAETQSVQEAAGIGSAPYGALILAAWRGHEAEAQELIDSTMRDAQARGEGIGVAIAEYARAVLCNGLGRHDEAALAARSASEHREVVCENWGLSELVEAAVRAGRNDDARDALARIGEKAAATGTEWARGIEARSRALVSDRTVAERAFQDAVAHLERTRVRSEVARTHLLYGEWLRRERRNADARAQLRVAHDLFTEMGMEAFSERARRELVATGERARRRRDDARVVLTPQEAQIARLALDGLSNPEIGAMLFLSSRTIEWHLRKVFAKLGISSRRELGGALTAGASLATV